MAQSSSRPADSSGSRWSQSKETTSSDEKDIPFDVNVGNGVVAAQSEDEQLIHQEETYRLAEPYVKRWNHLVSQTNWEKGSIIFEWRSSLMESGAPVTAYSDEAWSRSVAGVSSQHVGRLRRVYERFKDSYLSFAGLYWTHFMAALDWSDAELWLEGAVQSGWSVSQMRRTRWEALGRSGPQPVESEVVAAEADEDFSPLTEAEDTAETDRELHDRIGTTGPLLEGPDFGEGESTDAELASDSADVFDAIESPDDVAEQASPFASLPPLPVDIAEIMEQFKIAIVRHRAANWQDISPETIQEVLDALSLFARAGR